MSELHTHQLLTDDSGTETIEPEETIISDEKPHEIAEKTFADYNVRADIVESLADAGITHPFPIQAMTLPVALGGHDIIGQAKTGTGKTLGFGIPALQRVVGPDDAGFDKLPAPGAPQALVIVPTRELAVQVASDLQNDARKRNARITTIYGGRAYEPQVEALQKGVGLEVERLRKDARSRKRRLEQVEERLKDLGLQLDAETGLLGQTQHELEVQRELALAAVRAKSRFLANMSHELHTPLNAIIGYAEMLREELEDPDRRQDAERIIASSRSLLTLLQEVLNLSRLEAGQVHPVFEPVNVDDLFHGALERCAASARGGGVTVEVGDLAVGEVVSDPKRLGEALDQLMDNAVKFSPGGRVELSARRVTDDADHQHRPVISHHLCCYIISSASSAVHKTTTKEITTTITVEPRPLRSGAFKSSHSDLKTNAKTKVVKRQKCLDVQRCNF